MLRNISKAVLVFIFFLSGAASLGAWEIRSGLTGFTGLTYAGRWEPGWSASGADLEIRIPAPVEDWSLSGGLEYAGAGLGSQLMIPLGVAWKPKDSALSGGSWELGLRLLPGLTLTRPRPLILLGAEAGAGGIWAWDSGWFLSLNVGLRVTTSPEYSALVAEYTLWEVPARLGIGLRLP